MAVLSSRPRTGYELVHSIDGSIGFFWTASHQQVYKELSALEGEGSIRGKKVAQSAKPDKKVYRLTALGRRELRSWLSEIPDAATPPVRDALLIRMFVGYLAPPGTLLETLKSQATQRHERLLAYRAIRDQYFATERARRKKARRFQYLTLRRGILFEEAWLKWAAEAKALLADPG